MPRELATRPQDVPDVFADRFNTGDLAGVLEVYEPDALFAPSPGTVLRDTALRSAIEEFLALGLPITVTTRHALAHEDIALLIVDWSIRGTGPGGEPVDITGTATDVARRGEDGRWRYVIDNPFGTAESAPVPGRRE
ncbi:DUF4440 domain-containing protein [Solihabitans fulvus]|uniref:DUF4440 domain-containing protein n=1 Tax=Solihabitans fulvus TaxID=1892852 RepID=A0A5B2WTJ5_9PSEU|nr:nuclear transport factor 2 family protein [Solihabitans fulvus]KAA2254905.1 DUF4440 domain-containing protein [Solihabitans fulvus]